MMILPAIAVSLSLAMPAHAVQCGSRKDIIRGLHEKYQETRRFFMPDNAKQLVELYVSPSGTWTILVSTSPGLACILDYGENFQKNKKPAPEQERRS